MGDIDSQEDLIQALDDSQQNKGKRSINSGNDKDLLRLSNGITESNTENSKNSNVNATSSKS